MPFASVPTALFVSCLPRTMPLRWRGGVAFRSPIPQRLMALPTDRSHMLALQNWFWGLGQGTQNQARQTWVQTYEGHGLEAPRGRG